MILYRFAQGIRPFRSSVWRSSLFLKSLSCRPSTSGVINHIDHIKIENEGDARTLINHLKPNERELLLTILKENSDSESKKDDKEDGHVSHTEAKQLFVFNTLPFIGFGILDNMIMILAGEYIDQSLGVILSISTMAAAALGNIISDVAGVGLAHYIEFFVHRLGIKHPVLTAAQLESSKARFVVNGARAFGLIIGCLIGMFPLLFFD